MRDELSEINQFILRPRASSFFSNLESYSIRVIKIDSNAYTEHRSSRSALFDGLDGIEEGGLRASSSYSRDIDEHDNEKAMDSLQDRVVFLKRLTGDIHEEVENHNRMLDRMGNEMDASRGIMSGTMDRFKMVFEKKSTQRMCSLAGYFVVSFFLIYYLTRVLMYFMYG